MALDNTPQDPSQLHKYISAPPVRKSSLHRPRNCCSPPARSAEYNLSCTPATSLYRQESERFKCFTYAELMARDKANLDIFWLKDDSLADTENLPKPAVLAAEIVEDLEEALEEFRAVEEELKST